MREYYIFNLKKEFAMLYKDKPSELFSIFNRIYYMKEIDKDYGYNLFEQISNFFDKEKVNKFIKEKYEGRMVYSYIKDEHIINNLFLNEISVLKVKPSNLRLQTNTDASSFLLDLKQFDGNLFFCDFKNQDYFFLRRRDIKINKIPC